MVFKKHISLLLTILLLVSNLGLAFNVHYCGNEIESVTLRSAPSTNEEVDSCCGVVEKESQCCNDKVIKAEIKSDLIIVKSLMVDCIAVTEYWKPQVFTFQNNYKQRDNATYYCDAHAPPLYLLYRQYIFYA